jgi:xanthine dehydrogenase YagR molybdenum-binding subunit
VDVATLSLTGGKFVFGGEPARSLDFNDACKLLGTKAIEVTGTRFNNYRAEDHAAGVCGAMFAEVEVDRELGVVHVRRMVGVQDCGRVIDELTAQSQVIGAMIQGISYALHEDKVFDHRAGRMVNPDFLHYKIAGPKDMPEMEAYLVNVATGHTNTGAMGLGEPPAVAAPAAIANAVRNAIGAPVRSLPITPDKVLAALAARRS